MCGEDVAELLHEHVLAEVCPLSATFEDSASDFLGLPSYSGVVCLVCPCFAASASWKASVSPQSTLGLTMR
jgi:hypothetical protein